MMILDKNNEESQQKNMNEYLEIDAGEKNKYISLTKASKILEMDSLHLDTIRTSLNVLNLRRIKAKSRFLYYHIDDVMKVLNESRQFYNNHYCYHEVMGVKGVTKGKLDSARLKKVPIPSGFNALLSNTRFLNTEYKISQVAFRKEEFDKFREKFEKNERSTTELNGQEKNKYITREKTSEILGFDKLSRDIIDKCLSELKIRHIYIGIRKYYHIDDIKYSQKNVMAFYDNHYTYFEAHNLLGISDIKLKNSKIKKVKIPKGYNAVLYSKRHPDRKYMISKIAFLKNEIDKIDEEYTRNRLNDIDVNLNICDFIKSKEVLKVTGFTINHFKKILMESCEIRIFRNGIHGRLFHKEDINELVRKQKKFFSEYIDSASAMKMYPEIKIHHFKKLKCYDAPYYAVTKKNSISIRARKGVYKISDITQFLERKIRDIVNHNIAENTPFKTFKSRLNSHPHWDWDNCDSVSQDTTKAWFQFVEGRLNRSISKGKCLDININQHVRCTLLIQELLTRNNKNEIHLLTSNEINLFLNSTNVLKNKKLIYLFLKNIYFDVKASESLNSRCYKLSDIKIPPRIMPNKDADSENKSEDIIYDFEVYCEVFKYQLNLEFHTKKSIQEIEEEGTATYASVWLYTMLHLNNAWRHGDVRSFPKIEINDLLDDYGVSNISWFKENKIELHLSRAIISRVIQWEFTISKTQMKGRFFCSDELAQPIATAIIILTLFCYSLPLDSSNILMKFLSKYNEVSTRLLKKFFRGLVIKDFSFSSKKFNKTIMTYITYLTNMSGDCKSVEYAQWLRGHKRIGSTLHYIDFNVDFAEKLAKMLFARGEFGYIPSLLLQRLNSGEIQNFEATTEQLVNINRYFGDACKVNITISFLNRMRSERDFVANYISSKSLKECQTMLTDLYTGSLPSKEGRDVQCIFSKGKCQRIDLDDCFECQFHIPTIYALSTLCNKIQQEITEYSKTKNKPRRFRLSLKIQRKKYILIEAIQRFGKDYVYECLGMNRDEFLDRLSVVEFPNLEI
jgi:hypothetical protein